jgi:hypothetical protein
MTVRHTFRTSCPRRQEKNDDISVRCARIARSQNPRVSSLESRSPIDLEPLRGPSIPGSDFAGLELRSASNLDVSSCNPAPAPANPSYPINECLKLFRLNPAFN